LKVVDFPLKSSQNSPVLIEAIAQDGETEGKDHGRNSHLKLLLSEYELSLVP
jgi:hypothetical protein